jgi:hypothetical protein
LIRYRISEMMIASYSHQPSLPMRFFNCKDHIWDHQLRSTGLSHIISTRTRAVNSPASPPWMVTRWTYLPTARSWFISAPWDHADHRARDCTISSLFQVSCSMRSEGRLISLSCRLVLPHRRLGPKRHMPDVWIGADVDWPAY